MEYFPQTVTALINEFRNDPEQNLQRLLETFNKTVQEVSPRRSFRLITIEALLDRARRYWEQDRNRFISAIQKFLSQWVINNGVTLQLSSRISQISFFLNRWFRKNNVYHNIYSDSSIFNRPF